MRADHHDAGKVGTGGAHQLGQEIGQHIVAHDERAGKPGVFAARTEGERRRHGDIGSSLGQAGGDGPGDAGIGVEREMRPVLLERPQRQHQDTASPGGLHLGPGGACQLHAGQVLRAGERKRTGVGTGSGVPSRATFECPTGE